MSSKEKKFFPLFVDLTEKKAVVIGAGKIATRRIKTLLPFVKSLKVIAPEAGEEVLCLAGENELEYVQKAYETEDIKEADLVIAATDRREVNEQVYADCKNAGILVNIASCQQKCDFQGCGASCRCPADPLLWCVRSRCRCDIYL